MSTKQRLELEGRVLAMRRSDPGRYADQIAAIEKELAQPSVQTPHPTTTRRDERRYAGRGR